MNDKTRAIQHRDTKSGAQIFGVFLTIIIKAMSDFMANDHANAAKIQRLVLGGTEERRLQNSCRKDCKER